MVVVFSTHVSTHLSRLRRDAGCLRSFAIKMFSFVGLVTGDEGLSFVYKVLGVLMETEVAQINLPRFG